MNRFIAVVGDDPYYPTRKIEMWVSTDHVVDICPVYGVKGKRGRYSGCTSGSKGAVIVTYRLTGINGNVYFCNINKELQKLAGFDGHYVRGEADETFLSQLGKTGLPDKKA